MLVNVRVHIPSVPRFVRIVGTLGMVGIETLDDEEITSLGKLWTEALRERANELRARRSRGMRDA